METISNVGVIKGTDTTIIKFMQSSDNGYKGFGEAYFSLLPCGVERTWKIHEKTTCNLIVPYGKVLFMVAEYDLSSWRFIELGGEIQKRLTIPPRHWYGFLGVGYNESIIANIINIKNEDEQLDAGQRVLGQNLPKAKVSWNERTIVFPE